MAAAAMLPVALCAQDFQVKVSEAQEPMQTGKYTPTWESLSQYDVPDWFRDANLHYS